MTLYFCIEMPDGDFRSETIELSREQLSCLNLQPGEAVDEVLIDDEL